MHQHPRQAKILLPTGNFLSRMLPAGTAAEYGIARRCDIDGFIDISGFAFGDRWGTILTNALAARLRVLDKMHKPSILLPQMFGPFTTPEMETAFRNVMRRVSRIYARDPISHSYIHSIDRYDSDVRMAPDITIFTDPLQPDFLPTEPYACVVPNARMHDKLDPGVRNQYVPLLARVVEHLRSKGIAPYIVVHAAGNEDLEVARQLMAISNCEESQIVTEDDPRKLKGFIAEARLLVGSRFHAIVAALSSCIPAISIGWAHKYDALMEDFGVSEYVVSLERAGVDACDRIDQLLDSAQYGSTISALRQRREQMRLDADKMWQDVVELICLNR